MSQLYYWSFTLFTEEDHDYVIGEMSKVKRWVFQKERCPNTLKEHFQGHIHLEKKARLPELKKLFLGDMAKAHFSITSDVEKAQFYCLKEDSRVEGPWSDEKSKSDLRIEMPWDLAAITEWRPWQLDLFEKLKIKEDRMVNVLVDEKGNNGKSKVLKMALWKKWAGIIPCIGDSKDIIQACHSMGPRTAYILDLPRTGQGDKHLQSQINAIEQIKNGIVLDFRYKYAESLFGAPQIWVFTNQPIKTSMLTPDRWQQWQVLDNELKRRF